MLASRDPSCRRTRRATLSLIIAFPLLAGCAADQISGPDAGAATTPRHEGIECPPNYALQFDGVDDAVDLRPDPLGTPASVSVEAWVRLDELDKTHFLVTNTSNDFNNGFSLVVSGDNSVRFVVAGSGAGVAVSATKLEAERWYHVAGVYDADAGVVKVFIDGAEDGSAGYTGGIAYTSSRDLGFGVQMKPFGRSARFLHGTLDEIRIWSVARSAAEVADAMGAELEEPAADLAGYWPLSEGQGSTTMDASGSGNMGTLQGDPVWVEASWAGPCVTEVTIDVKPGDDPDVVKPINLNCGKVPVAIFSSPRFDVTEDLVLSSLTFGRTGDENSLHLRGRGVRNCGVEDVDGDGLPDLVCKFIIARTDLQRGDTEVFLKGVATDGTSVVGVDAVRVIGRGRR